MKNKNLALSDKRENANVLRPFGFADRVFEDFLTLPSLGFNSLPKTDIKETDREILLSVALPGVDKKDIHLDLTENALRISYERKEEKEESRKGEYYYKEQSYGKFYRSFTLPSSVKSNEAKAQYKDGVLKIILPKQKVSMPHKINID
jgi:HSP20 family protein